MKQTKVKQHNVKPEALKLLLIGLIALAESANHDLKIDPKDMTKLKSSIITWKSFCNFISQYMPETEVSVTLRYPTGVDEYGDKVKIPGVKIDTSPESSSVILSSIEQNELNKLLSRIIHESGVGQPALVHKVRNKLRHDNPGMSEAKLKSKVFTFIKKISVSSLTWKSFYEALEVIDATDVYLVAKNKFGKVKERVR